MNPSYIASMKATSTMILNAFLGISHKPKAEKKTSINGRAFAPGKGVQQEVSSEAKEAKVRAHLDKLAKETEARYAANPYDALSPAESYEAEEPRYPTSDLIDELRDHIAETEENNDRYEALRSLKRDRVRGAMVAARKATNPHWMPGAFRDIDLANARALDDAQQEEKEAFNTAADAKVMTALYGSDNGAKIDETLTYDQVLQKLHDTHDAYIERRIKLNAQETRERAMNAAIHTGDNQFEAQ